MPDFDWLIERNTAQTVMCPFCKAPIGEPCTKPDRFGVKQPIEHFPAHTVRTARARRAPSRTEQ